MKIKYVEHGAIKLYILPDDSDSKEIALKICKAYGYRLFPMAKEIGKNIVSECCSGHLLKQERPKEDSVCTVDSKLYDSLNLPFSELSIPVDDLAPASISAKNTENDITKSKLVFIAGKGIGSKANYERLKKLAKKFGAGIGCSRPVAMNGWESYDYAVGISGKSLKAQTVVCFGVSGAGPFIKGIENCEKIIAINNNKNALIFQNADYAVLDDCMNVISYLESL